MKKNLMTLSFILILTTIISAEKLNFSFNFDKPAVKQNLIETSYITKTSTPGEPIIPFYTAKILLPYGTKLSDAEVAHSDWELVDKDIFINYAKIPNPISSQEIRPTSKNDKIYSSNNPYPKMEFEIIGTETLAGHNIAIINLFPFRYLPKSAIVQHSYNWELNITINQDSKLEQYQSEMLCNSSSIQKRLEKLTINPDAICSYFDKEYNDFIKNDLIDPNEPHDYIIITSSDFISTFEAFRDWKNDYGLNAEIFATEDIYSNYTGEDDADIIRNFIIDAYVAWNSSDYPLEYVLLGGDDEVVPLRKLYVDTGYDIGHIPSDLYFSALDGNWDADNDGIYGEYPADSVDLVPEVAIGRIPGDTEINFVNALYKIMDYTENPKPALEKACMVGEKLWNEPYPEGTWGGDYKDDILENYIPEENYHFYTLYDRDGTYSAQAVKNMINDGIGIMNHLGHANYWILMDISPTTADQFTNNEYGLIYSQGCLPAAFDETTSMSSEAVAERMVIAENGPVAFIGNTRYGWGVYGSIEGPSQQYDRTFFDGLFAEDIKKLGDCNNYSKTELIGEIDDPWMRWCYYEIILFGDPESEIIVLDGEFPYLELNQITINDELGDNDGIVNPGEQISLIITLENLPDWQTANDVTATMRYDGEEITLIDSVSQFGSMSSGEILTSSDTIVFYVSDDYSYDEELNYQLFITANSGSPYPFAKTYYQSIDISLTQTNWPVYLGCEVKCSPVVVDFDNDGEKEILAVDRSGKIYSFESDASISSNFPVDIDEEVFASIAVGDINNNDDYEIVVATRDGNIYAINTSGTIILEYQSEEQMICTPSLADLNDDESLEIIASSIEGKLYVLQSDGMDYANFPYDFGSSLCSDAAICDIDSDGIKDIVVGTTNGSLYAINANGIILDGFPIETGFQIWSSPIIFDNNIAFSNYDNKIYIVDGSGNILFTKDISSNIYSSMSAFTQENEDEFFLAFNTLSGTLELIDENWTTLPGWPEEMEASSKNNPLAVDINGDGELEILSVTINGNIFCYSLSGDLSSEFPVSCNSTSNSPLTIDDIDNDGDFEIISGSNYGITVLDYKKPKGTYMPWSIFRGNMHRTGNADDNIQFSVGEKWQPHTGFILLQNYPNPFSSSTTISFNLATTCPPAKGGGLPARGGSAFGMTSGGKSHENTQIEIYNIKGQKVKTLNIACPVRSLRLFGEDCKLNIGKVVWDGKDEKGNSVSSGIYFYKLKSGDLEQTKKMILIK